MPALESSPYKGGLISPKATSRRRRRLPIVVHSFFGLFLQKREKKILKQSVTFLVRVLRETELIKRISIYKHIYKGELLA